LIEIGKNYTAYKTQILLSFSTFALFKK